MRDPPSVIPPLFCMKTETSDTGCWVQGHTTKSEQIHSNTCCLGHIDQKEETALPPAVRTKTMLTSLTRTQRGTASYLQPAKIQLRAPEKVMGSSGRGRRAEVMQLFHLDTARFRRAPNNFPSGASALPPLDHTPLQGEAGASGAPAASSTTSSCSNSHHPRKKQPKSRNQNEAVPLQLGYGEERQINPQLFPDCLLHAQSRG